MMKKWLAGGLAAVLLVSVADVSFGHGGTYRGPGDTVPPNPGGPGGDATPPGNPGGPGTPGPGAPTTGPGRAGPTGGGPVGPAGANPNPGRPSTGGGGFQRRSASAGFEQWEFWWEHNKEPFLNLKSRMAAGAKVTGSAGFMLGKGNEGANISANRVGPTEVNQQILPAIEPLLEEPEADVVDSAVLSIARMLRAESAADHLPKITKVLSHAQQTPRESAALALGVLGSPDAVPILLDLARDTTEGRKLSGRPAGVENRVRAFAAAALGLIGASEAIAPLREIVQDPSLNSLTDLKQLAVLSLGMMKEDHGSIVAFLKEVMNDRSLDRIVRAQAPIAIGRLNQPNPDGKGAGSPEARALLGDLVTAFEDDKTDLDMQRSLAVAIGMLGSMEEPAALETLINASQKAKDAQVQHYAIMSLARIGARDQNPDANREAHNKLENFFLQELKDPKPLTHKPYGALALGVYGRNPKLQGAKSNFGPKILESFNDDSNPSYQGAMAIALGLLGYEQAKEDLFREYDDSKQQSLKGYVAVALGMLGGEHAERFRNDMAQRGLEFKFRLQLARALGVMGDLQAVQTLISYLTESETLSETSSMAQSLGLIGDKSAIEPLLQIVQNEKMQPLQRGFAAVALGMMAEKTDLPWNAVFSVDSNYRAKTAALSEILDIL